MTRASAEAEQQAAQIDAREEGEVLALARRAANAGTFDLDIRERLVRYCPRSLEMLGHPPDRSPLLTPEEWAQHIFPGDAERVMADGLRARQAGTDLITEYRIVKPNGGIRWVRGLGRTLVDGNGEGVRCVGFNFDITEEKQAEATFRKMQADLIQASRANALATMAETLAHEVNQPLTAINNYLSGARALLNGVADDRAAQARDGVEEAIEAVHRAAEIIMSLRAVTRRASAGPGATMISIVAGKAVELALMGADELGIEAHVDFEPGLLVAVDELQVQQVVYNLVRNAVEAVEASPHKRIDIACRREWDFAILRVEDSGPGVPEAERATLFEPFVTTKGNGVGIGLATARTISEANGGKLWAEHLEAGTAFNVRLPIA